MILIGRAAGNVCPTATADDRTAARDTAANTAECRLILIVQISSICLLSHYATSKSFLSSGHRMDGRNDRLRNSCVPVSTTRDTQTYFRSRALPPPHARSDEPSFLHLITS